MSLAACVELRGSGGGWPLLMDSMDRVDFMDGHGRHLKCLLPGRRGRAGRLSIGSI
jgi:hypothetical protein